MTVIILDCCEHPRHASAAPARRTFAGVAVDLGRAFAATIAAGYAVALYGTVLGTAVGIALREALR